MTSPEDSSIPSHDEYDPHLTIEEQETLLLLNIQTNLSHLSDIYKYSQQLRDRFNGYTFINDIDNSNILLTAALPSAIRRWIENGNMTLGTVDVDFRTGSDNNTSTNLSITFTLDHDDELIIVKTVLPKTDINEDHDTITTILDMVTGEYSERTFEIIPASEAYNFIVSIISSDNTDLVSNYLSHQKQYQSAPP